MHDELDNIGCVRVVPKKRRMVERVYAIGFCHVAANYVDV